MKMLPNASPVEIIWTVFTACVASFALWNMIDAMRDLAYWNHIYGDKLKDSDTRTTAIARIRAEFIKFYVLSGFVFIGVLAMLSPAPPTEQMQITQYFAAFIFITIALFKGYDSIMTRIETHKLLNRDHISERLDRIMSE